MSSAWATVTASIISLVGSIILVFLNRLRKENKEDHGVVTKALDNLHEDMKNIETKLDNHISWHLKK